MARSSDSNFLVALFRDKTFQAREIRRVIGLTSLYLVITTVLVGIFYQQILGTLLAGETPLLFVSEDMSLANDAMPAVGAILQKWLLAMLAINAIVTVGVCIYITRRLGQPILAIKRALNEIANGNLDVRLRSSDDKEFGEISTALSAALRSVRLQITTAKKSMAEVITMQQVKDATNDGALDSALGNCRDALDYFQTDDDPELTLQDDDDYMGSNRVA